MWYDVLCWLFNYAIVCLFFCVVYYTFYLNNKPSHVVIPRGHGGYLASSRDSVSKFHTNEMYFTYLVHQNVRCQEKSSVIFF